MSGFNAINVEPEDNVEEEVDDTKEIQLEEAFKLYQNALKLQSQGPLFFTEAIEAYRELFRSEIFKYPEAIADFAHDQLEDAEPSANQTEVQTLSALPASATESSANSLPQLIYLAHKNRGQFVLEVARWKVQNEEAARSNGLRELLDASGKALPDYAQALEHDDTDIDLWKKAARVAEIFSSQRIVRFCLESVLAGDDDAGEAIDLSGLDEAYAAGELKEVVNLIGDDLSSAQSQDVKPRVLLLRLLKQRNDPYPYLPSRPKYFGYTDDRRRPISFYPIKHPLRLTSRTWLSAGQAILQILVDEQSGASDFGPGGAILIELPDATEAQQPSKTSRVRGGSAVASVTATLGLSTDAEPPEAAIMNGNTVESPQKADASQDDIILADAQHGDEDLTEAQAQPRDLGAKEVDVPRAEAADSEKPQQDPTLDSVSLPTRKRSSAVAGNEEPAEVRVKSKRVRARESIVTISNVDEEVVPNLARYYQDQLEDCSAADRFMLYTFNGLLSRLGIDDLGSLETLKCESDPQHDENDTEVVINTPQSSNTTLLADLRQALISWNDGKSQAVLYGHGTHDFGGGKAGLTLFLQHSKASLPTSIEEPAYSADDGLQGFAARINDQWSNIHDVILELLKSLLCPRKSGSDAAGSSYMTEKWSDAMKENIVLLIVREDEQLYKAFQKRLQSLDPAVNTSTTPEPISIAALELAQSLFELHLDIYCSITNPNSKVDPATCTQQRDRLGRWAELLSVMFNVGGRSLTRGNKPEPLVLRFLWASTTYGNKADEIIQEHIMLCLQDLRALLELADGPTITLPNNLAMPEISTTAVDQEVSRLSTLDFFMSVFDSDNSEAVDVIEKLEPILESTLLKGLANEADRATLQSEESQKNKLVAFLESGDASLKLYLWKRLQNAYQSISYTPKVVSCQLRAVETIADELETDRHRRKPDEQRQISMLKWLRDADELVAKLLVKILNESSPFESVDEDHLRSSMAATARLSRLLHGFALYEDIVRVGQVPAPSFRSASSTKLFEKSKDRLREMQVRLWTLQYGLLKEATVQCPALFPTASDDLADYLRSVHIVLGVRQYCKYSNKAFVKLAKSELLATQSEEDYSADVAQVLYDLHGLKFAPGVGDYDHGCPPENLDKKTALQLIPVIMIQANRINIRDFQKSELRNTIDKVQQALGALKGSPLISHNKRMISAFLKSVINPKDLYECIKGVGDLSLKPIRGDSVEIARQGWYFLLGNIALAKYKGIKRVNPTPTDELDVAATFFRHDLEHGVEKWETWYRLAQIYEAKIEDDLMWNSTKLNEHRQDVATLERNAVHAFSISVAVALRSADDHPDTAQKMSEMFSEFAMRLYSSSREPLSMEAFKTDKQIRHLSNSATMTMYKALAFDPMSPYAVWKFAAFLLRKRPNDKPRHWTSYYTLGKCLWKMFCNPEPEPKRGNVTVDEVLEAFTEAIEALPPKKEKGNEYILEPHFKLVSTVHKLVHRKFLTPAQGVEYLQSTPYARKVQLLEDEQGPDWDHYILDVLKRLGNADKSNWHHRIIARAAHVIYDDDQGVAGALGAKHELSQQIFTKTMTLQVWKPEHERPGRHYVYTGRYVRFFVSLLNQLNDRSSLDQLIRRIRRRPTDFLDHTKIWEEVTITYVRLLRRIGKIPEGHDKAVFDSLNHEEFILRADKLERWSHDPDNTSIMLDILRDAIELKKLNNSLMKGTMIDDLIVDTYAAIYETFVSHLPPEEKAAPQPPPPPVQIPQATFVTMRSLEQGVPVGDGRMSVGNLLTQTDGPPEMRPQSLVPIGLGLHNAPIIIGTQCSSIEPPRMPTPAKPGRVKQITKVELRRRAESLIVRPPPIKTPVLSKKPVVDLSTPTRDRTGSISVNVEAEIDGQVARMGRRMDELRDEEGAGASRGSSRRGSVHDSADDESELSEAEGVEDEIGAEKEGSPKLMFPGSMGGVGGLWNRMRQDDGDLESEGGQDEEGDEQGGERDRMEVDGESELEIQDSQEVDREKMRDRDQAAGEDM